MKPPVFIVGTARCGSTMMSNVVRLHPRLLSLSEFFTSLAGRAFTLKQPDGERFWRLLTTLSPIAGQMLAKGGPMEEVLYRFGDGARFHPHELPPILVTALPHLTNDHEALYDELMPILRSGARAPLGQHYLQLFQWLCRRFDRDCVVERSGSSLLFVPALVRLFPGARFVHLHRDGRDAAISMQRHPFFRLSVRFAGLFERIGLDPFKPPFISARRGSIRCWKRSPAASCRSNAGSPSRHRSRCSAPSGARRSSAAPLTCKLWIPSAC